MRLVQAVLVDSKAYIVRGAGWPCLRHTIELASTCLPLMAAAHGVVVAAHDVVVASCWQQRQQHRQQGGNNVLAAAVVSSSKTSSMWQQCVGSSSSSGNNSYLQMLLQCQQHIYSDDIAHAETHVHLSTVLPPARLPPSLM